MPIKVLSHYMASKIAAGEVVERPSSVVKELVENSIDAGANSISIEIGGGGLSYITVTDNGVGIPGEEISTAFQRFATSKISDENDLENITSLGFRGEALPSIAAVADIDLTTRYANSISGNFVRMDGGNVIEASPKASPVGTSITVASIFSKMPARLKFLKTSAVESNRIQVLIRQIAIAFPNIKFNLTIDGKGNFSTAGIGDLRGVCSDVYGYKVAASLIEIGSDGANHGEENRILIKGLIGPPEISRSNRSYINLMVNGRVIQSRSLSFAVEQAYHGFLKERRHPVAIINIEVPADELDVNVHPAKSEVRFVNESDVFSTLQKSIRQSLLNFSPLPNLQPNDISQTSGFVSSLHSGSYNGSLQGHMPIFPSPSIESFSYTPREVVGSMYVIGQSQQLYIVADGPEGLFLVDQHAAHERVLYEDINNRILSGAIEVQGLLTPQIVDVPANLFVFLSNNNEKLNEFGFGFEEFGSNAVILRSIPSALRHYDPSTVFLDILEEIAVGKEQFNWQENLSKSLACHSAVRSGDTMTRDEMEVLLISLGACVQPNTCPHGRPTMFHLTAAYLEKRFGRT